MKKLLIVLITVNAVFSPILAQDFGRVTSALGCVILPLVSGVATGYKQKFSKKTLVQTGTAFIGTQAACQGLTAVYMLCKADCHTNKKELHKKVALLVVPTIFATGYCSGLAAKGLKSAKHYLLATNTRSRATQQVAGALEGAAGKLRTTADKLDHIAASLRAASKK